MGFEADPQQQQALLDYLALLLKWNKAFNLTAVRDPSIMVSRHLLDSLSILPFVAGPRVLDVGTGAGLPGIPLAIALPSLDFTLLDTNSKKTRFVKQVKLELALDNVAVVQQRVEQYQVGVGFNTITSRAFASLPDMLAGSRHLLAHGGRWLAMKAELPTGELKDLPAGFSWESRVLSVPGEVAPRNVIVLR